MDDVLPKVSRPSVRKRALGVILPRGSRPGARYKGAPGRHLEALSRSSSVQMTLVQRAEDVRQRTLVQSEDARPALVQRSSRDARPAESRSLWRDLFSVRLESVHINESSLQGTFGSFVPCYIKGFDKSDLNNLLFDEFNVNYNTLEPIFRQGSCLLKTVVEDVVKYTDNGAPIKRHRRKIIPVHSKKIAGKRFWNEHILLLKELGGFIEEINNVTPEYVRSFEFDSKLMPSTWIVVRIDGCHFHRFSEVHEFVKPNDDRALNLMNLCAVAVLEKFWEDIVFAYGVSDEYSFIIKKTCNLYQRRANKMVSAIVSFFTSTYVMRWNEFFPQSELKYPPSFDGRAVCYPSTEILRDYLSWRQVDCHINNQYNSCFWKLVASGKSKREAQNSLKGGQLQKKIEELAIDYNKLPVMFRQGSSVYRDKVDTVPTHEENGNSFESKGKVIVEHVDIIGPTFWLEHLNILDE
ncbi:hypothetical protein LR48_Vigan08g012400 [Vigna angularis]|uniref:tRNA(His) guanylyltransferase n=1 Tax=Phaseolus angularis TaxID=3914 RepID=A0A0L9V309_PHAAN|nr:hypothetical protein LR48_Vigan08g012400 [Vigna angularis]